MKENRGVTLISLMIYIVVLSILVGVTANFSKQFYRNTDNTTISINSSQNYTRVINYLAEDVNSGLIDSIDISDNDIVFTLNNMSKHQYFYDDINKKIYFVDWDESERKNVMIDLCSNVDECEFSKFAENDKKFSMKIMINQTLYNNIFIVN